MGFALERFAESVDPDFQCRLCGQVLEEPLCTPCGHVFCARCLLPWAARRRRCPLQCRPLAPGELYRVLPLRSLVQKLRIQCDYRPRGCGRSVQLSELAAHVERCDFGPASRRHLGSVSRPDGPGSGDRSVRGGCRSAPGIRRGGGGGSRGGSPGVCGRSWRGPGPRVWRRREKALLAQLWELQGEVRLIARRYQEKLTQYMAHVRNFVRDLGGGHDAVRLRDGVPGNDPSGWKGEQCFLALKILLQGDILPHAVGNIHRSDHPLLLPVLCFSIAVNEDSPFPFYWDWKK